MRRNWLLITLLLFFGSRQGYAVELRFSAASLQRTLETQLFASNDGRYFLRGDQHSPCYVSADSPRISFQEDRVLVHLHTNARLGTRLGGECIGIHLSPDVDVSLVPVAEGEAIGFRDARLEKLSGSRELDFILKPFLARKIPSALKIDAATLLRQLLAHSAAATGYTLTLDKLKIHSMNVEGNTLVVDVDGDLSVN